MKPSDPVSLYNWEALNERNLETEKLIKKRMDEIWRKNYNKAKSI